MFSFANLKKSICFTILNDYFHSVDQTNFLFLPNKQSDDTFQDCAVQWKIINFNFVKMKKLILLASFAFLLTVMLFSQKSVTLRIDYSFQNIEKGHDLTCMTKVFANGELVATSEQHSESNPFSFSCEIPKGECQLKIVNYALYNGTWEEHTVANDYSIDCVYEIAQKFTKKAYRITIVFDVNKGVTAKIK
jgi:hypothetical protein